jgi:hypothetical protein
MPSVWLRLSAPRRNQSLLPDRGRPNSNRNLDFRSRMHRHENRWCGKSKRKARRRFNPILVRTMLRSPSAENCAT